MHPIDNINVRFGDDLAATLKAGSKLQIAAASFSMYAYEALRESLTDIDELQFVFNSPTFVDGPKSGQTRKERREFFIPKAQRESTLHGSAFEIKLKNELTQKAIARECADWIRRKATFRSVRTEAHFSPVVGVRDGGTPVAAYMNVPSFTTAELGVSRGDAISYNIFKTTDAPVAGAMLQAFEQLWHDGARLTDVTEALCASIETVYQENSPERIYYFTLYNLFREFLEDITDDVLPNERLGYRESLVWQKLFNFQTDAATGIINKLETYNGCILADSVGLGKTFTALAVIKYYEMRNRAVLVLCPKKLSENWLNYNSNLTTNIFAKDRFNYDVLSHTDLSRTRGEANGMRIDRINWGNYDLVVIDESHNFRNAKSYGDNDSRYELLMKKVIQAGAKTKVLMLSATPVNNRFGDLKNQLALAYEGESEQLSAKLRTDSSIDDIFRQAQTAFNRWVGLPSEERTTEVLLDALDFDFFELLDSVTIARSRKHIERYYDTSAVGNFPVREKPISVRSPLTARDDVYDFNEIYERLTLLTLAIYNPIAYVLPSRLEKYQDLYDSEVGEGRSMMAQRTRESGVKALMTTNLLKRLESSVHAFRITLGKLSQKLDATLFKIDAFERSGGAGTLDWNTDEVDAEEVRDTLDMDEMQVGGRYKFDLADMDVRGWREHLAADRHIVHTLTEAMEKVTSAEDAKLQDLLQRVLAKAAQPLNGTNKKVLVFTAFADTANYLYDNLSSAALARGGMHTGIVTGSDRPRSTLAKSYDFQSILTLFSPRSKEKALTMPNEAAEIEFLVATDCISEGQNLQDCDYLINYDIHWNPVRIIQRFGRVDRIGSQNATIQLVNYWPDISLDEYINLKERVENRMVIADVTATGDDNVLTNKNSNASYRREQLSKLQDEVIELEDAKAGIAITDLGLNDFRMDLVAYVREHDDVGVLPKGLHAVVPADPARGLPEGVVFVLRNLHDNPELAKHNRLHPHYLVYLDPAGEVIVDHTEPKKLLDLLRANCRGRAVPVAKVCRTFNARTRDGADMKVYSALLSRAIAVMVARKQEKDVDSIFSTAPSTAFTGGFAELGDFELTAFIIVEPRR